MTTGQEDIQGIFITVVGSSGSGKRELTRFLEQTHPEFIYPPSATTRAPRPGERDGEKYRFLSDEAFDRKIADGAFLEWAHFGGNRYGTLKTEILGPLAEGKVVFREVEIQGVRALKKQIPDGHLVTIFIDGGSWDELDRRIRERAPIEDTELSKRKERYEEEVSYREEADYVIINERGKLEDAKHQLGEVIGEITRKKKRI